MENYKKIGFGERYFKIVKGILAVLFGLFALFVIVSLFLPSDYEVDREIVINAKYSTIDNLIATPAEWTKWSIWNPEKDSTIKFNFEGPQSGKNAEMYFKGDLLGDGKLRIDEYSQTAIDYTMSFADGSFINKGTISLNQKSNEVLVKWKLYGNVGWNPFAKFFRNTLQDLLATDIDENLKNLKKVAENETI